MGERPEMWTLRFEVPKGGDPAEILAEIVAGETEDSGYVRTAGDLLSWDLTAPGSGVVVDRRQRLAAAMLLMGFDLPQPMTDAALSMKEAAAVCPGLTTGEMPTGRIGRVAALTAARRLIDEMLSEPQPSGN